MTSERATAFTAHRARLILLTVLPVVLALWAQWAMFFERLLLDGVVLFAISAVLFRSAVVSEWKYLSSPAGDGGRRSFPIKWSRIVTPLTLALGFSILAWLASGGNRFRPETVIFWVLAVGFYIAAFWERAPDARIAHVLRRWAPPGTQLRVPWSVAGLVVVMLVAAFFRFHQIASVPAEMVSDHAEKLLDVRDVMNGEHRIFFPRNTGREPMQFYMAVPFVWLVGLNHLALKLLTATVSLATVPVVFLIGRELAGARYGLLAAALLAISKWDVTIGRVGLRFPFYPFFTALSFYFLLRALKYGRRNDYLLCGLATGIGLYGYSPFRVMLIIIAGTLAAKVLFELKRGIRPVASVLGGGMLSLGAAAVVFIPLARYMFDNPLLFWQRTLTRLTESESEFSHNPLVILAGNTVNGLGMFNWMGDVVWVNNVPYDPALDYVTGGLFVLGATWCITTLLRHREPVAAYLLLALLSAMLPSTLSIAFPGENPSVVRSGGTVVFVVLLAALPLHLSALRVREVWPGTRGAVMVAVMVGAVLLLAGQASYERYFGDYALQYRQRAINVSEVARVIDGFRDSVGSTQNAYIKMWPHWLDMRSVAFSLGLPDWRNELLTNDDLVNHPAPDGNKLYILHREDREGARLLQERFPRGELYLQPSAVPGKEFQLFFAPGDG